MRGRVCLVWGGRERCVVGCEEVRGWVREVCGVPGCRVVLSTCQSVREDLPGVRVGRWSSRWGRVSEDHAEAWALGGRYWPCRDALGCLWAGRVRGQGRHWTLCRRLGNAGSDDHRFASCRMRAYSVSANGVWYAC